MADSFPELKARFEYAPGKAYGGQFSIGTRLISGLCVRGLLVRARPRGSWRSNLHQYALLPSWLPDVDLNATTPDAAQAQLVRWYLHALGPATFEDIAWWSGFTKRETKKALSALGGEPVEVEIEGLPGDYLMLAVDQQRLEAVERSSEPIVNLLPSLDPYIVGYRDRRRFIDPEHYDQVFDRAGNPFATVWTNAAWSASGSSESTSWNCWCGMMRSRTRCTQRQSGWGASCGLRNPISRQAQQQFRL